MPLNEATEAARNLRNPDAPAPPEGRLYRADDGIDALWAREAEDRIAGYDAGQIEAFDADEVLANETALLSEPSLSDWNRPEEDAAWSYLQRER